MAVLRPPKSWRFIVTDLAGETVTMLDHLATERIVTPLLGDALAVTGKVPSDNPQINILHTDGFPFLAEGVRQLYCFRQESTTIPYFTIRASTLLMQLTDAAEQDAAFTRFSAWDPWQYMMSRPVLVSAFTPDDAKGDPLPAGTVAGDLIPDVGITYPSTMTADEIVLDLIGNTVAFADGAAPPAAQDCFLDFGQFGSDSTNTTETCVTFSSPGWPIQQGTMLGQALKDLMASGVLDITMTPIWDPSGRPGILCALNIFTQDASAGTLGAGIYNYSAQFAWDRPGRSLVGVDNLYDGTGRANYVQYYSGQGGPPVAPQTDPKSIALYGEYWAQQFFPATQQNLPAVVALAAEQLSLRSRYRETLTVNPAPERSPQPFVDYGLGDAVPDLMSNRMRQALPPETTSAGTNAVNSATVNVASTNQFPNAGQIVIAGKYVSYTGKTATSFTGCGSHAATVNGETITVGAWQRVYGIPVEIDDNGVETVRELLVGTVGAPP